jgi:hypothetical protein
LDQALVELLLLLLEVFFNYFHRHVHEGGLLRGIALQLYLPVHRHLVLEVVVDLISLDHIIFLDQTVPVAVLL